MRVILFFAALTAVHLLVVVPVEIGLRAAGVTGGDTTRIELGVELIRFLASLVATLAAVAFMCRFIDRRRVEDLGVRREAWGFLEGCGWGALLVTVVVVVLFVTGQIEDPVRKAAGGPAAVAAAVSLFVVASIIEELIFRAYFLVNTLAELGRPAAVAVSSVVFAFAHSWNPDVNGVGFINILLAGVLLGVAYAHRRRFWMAVGLHFAWNYFQGPVFGFDVSGYGIESFAAFDSVGGERWTGGEFGLEGSLVTTVVLVCGILLLELRERAGCRASVSGVDGRRRRGR